MWPEGFANPAEGASVQPTDWRSRVIQGQQLAQAPLPVWAENVYLAMRSQVGDDRYPCFFGVLAEKRGEMFYTFIGKNDLASLPICMATFAALAQRAPFDKYNIAVFFEPDPQPLSHAAYHDRFWQTLQLLHEADCDPHALQQLDPADAQWEFCYRGVEMFVVCACPSFDQRRSRNLGPGMVLLFQPRSVFIDQITNKVIGRRARQEVRKRLQSWDAVAPHPDLGFYGDPGNLEWKQYFLPDDNRPTVGTCPFRPRRTDIAASSSGPEVQTHETQRHDSKIQGRESQLPAVHAQRVIAPRGAAVRVPLSLAQERLWLAWKLEPQNAAHHLNRVLELRGVPSTQRLQAAVAAVVERHESLRTRFEEHDGAVWQCVATSSSIPWRVVRCSGEPGIVWREKLAAVRAEAFDLRRGPLLRVLHLERAADDHILQLTLHPIVADAASMEVLVDEIVRRYADPAVQFDPLTIQYADYALWQRERLTGVELDRQLDYWREVLGTEHPVLELPLDRPRRAPRSAVRGTVWMPVSGEVIEWLRALAVDHQTTLLVTLLAGLQALLYRYSGQRQLRLGVRVAGREHQQTERLIGCFANTLVLSSATSGATRFSELLALARERMAAAQAHLEVPFEDLVQALAVPHSLAHTPLFQVLLHFQHTKPASALADLPALSIQPCSDGVDPAGCDLVFGVLDGGSTLEIRVNYACDVFDAATVQRVCSDWLLMLAQFGRDAEVRIGAVELRRCERRPLPRKAFEPVHQRLSSRARQVAQQPALQCDGRTLTYADLERWSQAIALGLRACGVAAEVRVGLCVQRSVGMVAGLLGILKSGGAFVPLDPEYPSERLMQMLVEARVGTVVTDEASALRCAAVLEGRRQVRIEMCEQAVAPLPPLDLPIEPQQLAYVIYTSGSSGMPKGVAISHEALAQHLDDFIECYGITAQDKQLQSATINFDVALHELLPALLMGGQVHMRGAAPWELESLDRTLREAQVTFARIPTAYWQQWLRSLPQRQSLPRLRQITVGGEALPADALERWYAGPLAGIALDNLYGPTETTAACLAHRCEPGDGVFGIVPIGRAYASRAVCVVDRDGDRVPIGGLGELCIGGQTLARGYLERPSLTAERFVPDPAGHGGRLYRSGDLCRERADGVVEYVGRLDSQVKLRGYRIELGEVEAALRRCAGVSAALVALRGEGEAVRLVGYVVGEVAPHSLRAALQKQLPGYMVPAQFVMLDELPLLPNGKVNHQALFQADSLREARAVVAPRTVLEQQLFEIWHRVLELEHFGVTDNFFELGGNSLDALQLASLARGQGLHGFSLEALFAAPTIAALADYLQHTAPQLPGNVLPLNRQNVAAKLFCFHPGSGLIADYRHLADAVDGEVAVYGVQAPFYSEPHWQPASFAALLDEYAARVRTVQPRGPYRLLGWSLGGWIALGVAARLEQTGAVVIQLGLIDIHTEMRARIELQARALGNAAQPTLEQRDTASKVAHVRAQLCALSAGFQMPNIAADIDYWLAQDSGLSVNPHSTWAQYTTGSAKLRAVYACDHRQLVAHADLVADASRWLHGIESLPAADRRP